jgi:ABC-type transport system involved in multi-copper enzyme maturation permease subunit
MTALVHLAWNGFRESRRNRVTVVVGLFAFLMIFAATLSLELTVFTFERVMTDVGLGTMSLITAFLTIFLGTALLPREIERRTIFMVLSKPIGRSTFLVGRLLGNVLTVAFVALAMSGLFVLQLLLQGAPFRAALFNAIFGLLLEVVLLSSLGFLFSSFSSQFVAAVSTVGLYFTGHMSPDLYRMAQNSKTPALHGIGQVLYFVLPNLDRLDLRAKATYAVETSASELLSSAVYALGYSAICVAIACVLFQRRDFK